MDEECRKIQEDEKIVILAVYENEAKIEANVWKVWKPLVVTIHLDPVESVSRALKGGICVDLTVTCTSKYPKEPPSLTFSNVKGISSEAIGILQRKLDDQCKSLLGCPMIVELCNEVREFLYENTTSVHGSFHDNMVKKNEQEKKEKQRQRLNSERREVEQIVEERERHNMEAQFRKEEERPKPFLEDAQIRVIGNRTIAVKSTNIPKRPRPHNLCNEWVGVYQNEELLVSEWVFKYTLGRPTSVKKKPPVFDEFLKKCDEIEGYIRRFPALVGLDQTVVPYLFCEFDRRSTTPQNINVHVTIGQKVRASEQSLAGMMNSMKHEPNICRRLAGHAICALRWLHEDGLAHGSVSSNSFWVSDNSFRLSDAGTLSTLTSLCDVFQQAISGNMSISQTEEKITRKKDLFALGTMIDGIRLSQCSSSTVSHVDDDLTKFITTCQCAKSVEELLNLPYLKVDLAESGSGDSRFGSWDADQNCRLFNEFILMKKLGRGGFGEVLLARNKVDDSNYAIKRIPLYAKSEKLNRRITREAKLFAKLNHPNVVRYYSAWIESTSKQKEPVEGSKKLSPNSKPKSAANMEDSLLPTKLRNLELVGVARGDTSEWSTSYNREDSSSQDSSSDSEDSLPVETLFSPRDRTDDEFDIIFEGSSDSNDAGESGFPGVEESLNPPIKTSEKYKSVQETDASSDISPPSRVLFIQMEFCGHSTLRAFIDNSGLIGNPKVIWRMFREMLSGLSYIHRQGMIHRDIKPMNILLDEEDRIKIGDFGLATRDFFRKMDAAGAEITSKVSGQTKDIGTELYMAPELFNEGDSVPYTSKIDVYSTGIVLFEMFYRPIPPGMQRLATMRNIKKSIYPDDFGQGYSPTQRDYAHQLISWMLHEQADNRPSVDDLLADERIIEDIDAQSVQAVLQKSLKRGTRNHASLMNSLFKEEISGGQNYCFDMIQCQEKEKIRPDRHVEFVREKISDVLRTHSFEPLHTHTLLPATCVQNASELRQKPVHLLDSSGFPVSLPMDLRQNFVRYCCRNAVFRMKRFTFDRVYRRNDDIGFVHPYEKWECSLDCVGPLSTATTVTSELLDVACEITLATLPNLRFSLRIGHMGLVVAALRHLTVPEDMTQRILQKLHEISTSVKNHSIADKTDMLAEIVGSRIAASLLSYLPADTSFIVFKDCCKMLVRSRDDTAREAARSALNEIEKVSQILHSVLDLPTQQINVVFDASLVYRPSAFRDGIVFLVATDLQSKKGPSRGVVIGGGRYDSSLTRERHPKDPQPPVPLYLVGCSVSLEMINNIRRFAKIETPPVCATIVCSYKGDLVMEKFLLARRLWKKDVAADIIHEPVEQLDDLISYCESRGVVNFLVVFGRDEVLVRSEGVDHGKVDYDSAVALLSHESDDEHELFTIVTTPVNNSSRASMTPTHSSINCATFSNCVINFAIPDRMMFSVKKRVENQVRNVLAEAVALFSARGKIEIVVTELSKDLVKTIAGAMSRNTPVEEMSVLFDGLSRQFGKSKQDLESMFDCLKQICSPRREVIPVLILFRHQDSFYKTIT